MTGSTGAGCGKFSFLEFSGRWYNGQEEEKKTMYIGNKRSLLVGMARLRQLRVKSSKSFLLFTFKSNSP